MTIKRVAIDALWQVRGRFVAGAGGWIWEWRFGRPWFARAHYILPPEDEPWLFGLIGLLFLVVPGLYFCGLGLLSAGHHRDVPNSLLDTNALVVPMEILGVVLLAGAIAGVRTIHRGFVSFRPRPWEPASVLPDLSDPHGVAATVSGVTAKWRGGRAVLRDWESSIVVDRETGDPVIRPNLLPPIRLAADAEASLEAGDVYLLFQGAKPALRLAHGDVRLVVRFPTAHVRDAFALAILNTRSAA